MTTRFNLQEVWASSGERADPDTDTTHPIFEPNKYTLGWDYDVNIFTNNKHPYQWRNFLTHFNLSRQKGVATTGSPEWHEETNYASGSLCRGANGLYYRALQDNINKPPEVSAEWTDSLLSLSEEDVVLTLSNIGGDLTTHTDDLSDPHSVLASQFNSYSSDEIDDLVEALESTQLGHEGDSNNPHQLTREQANVLGGVEGGTFEGQVNFLGGLHVGSNSISWFSSMFGLKNSSNKMGIHQEVYPLVELGGKLLHEGNYTKLRTEKETLFSTSIPILHLPLVAYLSSLGAGDSLSSFSRPTTKQYTTKSGDSVTLQADEDGYDAEGMVWTNDTTLSLLSPAGGPYKLKGTTLVWIEDGVTKSSYQAGVWTGVISDLITNGTNRVRNFRAYIGQLTSKQLSMLGQT